MADVPGNSSTTVNLAVGSTTSGSLEILGDHDWYRISLAAGQSITVTLNGITLTDPYLYIRNSSGGLLYSNDDISSANRDSQVAFSAPSSGTYYIDVGAWNEQFTGNYQLNIQGYAQPPLFTNDQIANQVVSGYWGGDSHHFNVTQGGTITVNITALTAAGQTLARAALAQWSDIIGVRFQEVSVGGQITFDDSEDGAFADGNWSRGITSSAHVNVSTTWLSDYGTRLNSYSFQTYVHEVGHALGLGHAGNYNETAQYPYDALFRNDAWSTSVMSYFSQRDNSYFAGQGFTEDFVVTPMVADILGMQALYGLSTTTRAGDTTYGFNSTAGRDVLNAALNPGVAYTIFDSGGTDTLDYSGFSTSQLINLNPETFSNVGPGVGNVTIARGVVIENVVGGAGNDTLLGNSANNVLWGRSGADTINGSDGNDTIDGGPGADILDGGAGNDRVYYDSADSRAQVSGGAGTDTLVFDGLAAPSGYNLSAQAFEQAEIIQHDAGSNSWSTIAKVYNASWENIAQDWLFDNGTRTYSTIDADDSQNWTQIWFNYDAAGRFVSQDLHYDNGTSTWTVLDADNSKNWSQTWSNRDAQGRLVSQDVHFDNGTRTWTTLDAGDSHDWTQLWFNYDAQGRFVSEDLRYDDGTRTWTTLDAADTAAWSQQWSHYDAQGHLYAQVTAFDDGHTSTVYF